MGDAYRVHETTGSTDIDSSLDPGVAGQLESFELHLDAAGGANSLTITRNSLAGSDYDVVWYTKDMTAVTDILWVPDRPLHFEAGDLVDIAWTNAGGATYGLTLKWRGI